MKNRPTSSLVNVILKHLLDLYEESSAVPNHFGWQVLKNFQYFLKRWFHMMMFGLGYLQSGIQKLDLTVIKRLVSVIIGSCLKIKRLQDNESEVFPSKGLVEICNKYVTMATGFIMMLMIQNRPIPGTNRTEANLAKELLNDMIQVIPEVVSQPLSYKKPIQHVILEGYLSLAWQPTKYNMLNECKHMLRQSKLMFYKPLIESIQDINAKDHEGNTLLLVVASQI